MNDKPKVETPFTDSVLNDTDVVESSVGIITADLNEPLPWES